MALTVPVRRARGRPAWRWGDLSLAARFNLASLLVLLISMLVTGWWVGAQIRQGVIHRTAATAALYVENFLVTQLQELGSSTWLSAERRDAIEHLLATTPLGREIVSIKIWAPGGRVVYGQDAGGVFPVKEDLERAWRGEISADITNLRDEENASQRGKFRHLIETYVPMRIEGSDRVIAVAEFYQTTGPLEAEIAQAQRRSWAAVGLTTLLTYLLLSGLVRRGSDTIRRQQATLREQVGTLERLLTQNAQLHGRVSRAAARTAAHSERVLRRVSSDLHDGPAQDLSYALLRLDSLTTHAAGQPAQEAALRSVEQSLEAALREVRAIATDLRLPDLLGLSLHETLERALRDHRRRTGVDATLHAEALPDGVPLPVKITAFRIVQEALNNAARHAPGRASAVHADAQGGWLTLRITDGGPGFTWTGGAREGHLGLVGMRERAESLGGTFTVTARPEGGTAVEARVPLHPAESHPEDRDD
ncbi:signal transduction histidine kinase [Deinococcus metalli]|uniref:Histidine kinase n=1 Tax=Deinococcus metalli TaxID=1141878 RepID=A0A7W8KG43_9DEIO|nr:sensor histidine kinase [Deinococcus metalli]MBB5377492.1 signal transduction histidine kinase [Deinococcus metalli]GHF50842.1 histidine kinase [Deinococcus metalli]